MNERERGHDDDWTMEPRMRPRASILLLLLQYRREN
jgi:hypothetical protein